MLCSCLAETFKTSGTLRTTYKKKKRGGKREGRVRWNLRSDRVQTERAEEMKLEKQRAEQGPGLECYGQRSTNTRTFSGRIIHCLLREPESKPLFPSQCFLPQKELLLDNRLHAQSLHLAGLYRTPCSSWDHLHMGSEGSGGCRGQLTAD